MPFYNIHSQKLTSTSFYIHLPPSTLSTLAALAALTILNTLTTLATLATRTTFAVPYAPLRSLFISL